MASGGVGGKEVGRLSIRVVPDMDGFREEVWSEANAAAHGAKPDVKVDADTDPARRKIEEVERGRYKATIHVDEHEEDSIDSFRRRILRDLNRIRNETELRIPITPDGEAFRQQMDRVTSRFQGNAVKPIDMDVDIATGQREKLLADVEALKLLASKGPIHFSLDVDNNDKLSHLLDDFGKRAREAERALNQSNGQSLLDSVRSHSPAAARGRELEAMAEDFKVKVVPTESSIEELRERLKHENYTAKVKLIVDEENLNRMRRTAEHDLDKIFSRLDPPGDGGDGSGGGRNRRFKVPDVLPNIGGLGGGPSLVLILGALSLLAPALSLLSQVLVGLPALVGAVALPIGVMALGFKGIKDAMDESGFLDLIQGKKKGSKDKQGLGVGLKEIQEQVADVFRTGLTPAFKKLGEAIPQLLRGLPFVASGLVTLGNSLVNALVNPTTIAAFDRFTNSVGSMLTNLAPGIQIFTNAMVGLIANVGDHLPGLGNTMTEWADEFQNWVTKISKPKSFWGEDVPNSSDLDQAISNMKPILNAVKDFIGNLFGAGIDMAKTGDMTKNIKDFFDSITNFATGTLPALAAGFDKIADFLRSVGLANDPVGASPAHAGKVGDNPQDINKNVVTALGVPIDKNGYPYGVKPLTKDELPKSSPFPDFMDLSKTGGIGLLSPVYEFLKRNFGPGLSGVANAGPQPFDKGTPATAGKAVPGSGFATSAVQGAGQTIQAPKIEVPKLPPGSEKIWEPLIQATATATTQVQGSVTAMVGGISASLASLAGIGQAAGMSTGMGLAQGIVNSTPSAVGAAASLAGQVSAATSHVLEHHSPSKVYQRIGESTGQGFEIGMNDSFQSVIEKSKALAAQVSDSMQNGGILSPQMSGAVQKDLAVIGVQYDKLKQQRDALDPKDKSGRAGIKAQMDQLRDLRTELGLGNKESKYNSKYGGAGGSDSTQQAASMITQALASGLDAMKGLVMANVNQLGTDLGMSGNGAVEKLADYGIGFLSSAVNSVASSAIGGKGGDTHYHVTDTDDLKRVENNNTQRMKLQHDQR